MCCGVALKRVPCIRVCSFTYPPRVLQLTDDFCGKNDARVILGSYCIEDQASLLCIYLCHTVALFARRERAIHEDT